MSAPAKAAVQRYTDEQLRAAWEAGGSMREIADELGVRAASLYDRGAASALPPRVAIGRRRFTERALTELLEHLGHSGEVAAGVAADLVAEFGHGVGGQQ